MSAKQHGETNVLRRKRCNIRARGAVCVRSILWWKYLYYNYILIQDSTELRRSCHIQYVLHRRLYSFINWQDFRPAVFLYDWILTFHNEIQFMWKPKITTTTVLFILNRYLYASSAVAGIIDNFATDTSEVVSVLLSHFITWEFILSLIEVCPSSHCASREVWSSGCYAQLSRSWKRLRYTGSTSWFSDRWCDVIYMIIDDVYQLKCVSDGSAFQLLRVYAISGRMWQLALLVALANVYPLFFSIVRRNGILISSCPPYSRYYTLLCSTTWKSRSTMDFGLLHLKAVI